MRRARRLAPWIVAAALCLVAILTRQFLIQPPEVAQRCDLTVLAFTRAGPWWCNVRAAAIMTYAWGGLFDACLGLSVLVLLWRRAWVATVTLSVGLVAIVLYTYEPGALAITIGALVLARRQQGPGLLVAPR